MKTLIVYSSKYGSTAKCAASLSTKLKGEVDLFHLGQGMPPARLADYDQIIIGGSIYMGRIQQEVTLFCTQAQDELAGKRIGLFICCMKDGEDAQVELARAYPPELFQAAIAREAFGGEVSFGKLNMFDYCVIRWIVKIKRDTRFFLPENINRFVLQMNESMRRITH
jgi:menaquinone-dependent protoporphyrinogen oxidase